MDGAEGELLLLQLQRLHVGMGIGGGAGVRRQRQLERPFGELGGGGQGGPKRRCAGVQGGLQGSVQPVHTTMGRQGEGGC